MSDKPTLSEEEIRRLFKLDDWEQDDCPGSEQLAPCWHDLINAARRIERAVIAAHEAKRQAGRCECEACSQTSLHCTACDCQDCWRNRAHEMQAERDALRRNVGNLLAVLHGDGGQHTEHVGLEQSCIDAEVKRHEMVKEIDALRDRAEQAEARLAGCLVAAEGGTRDPVIAKPGDYGWSESYRAVLALRRECDALREKERKREEVERLQRGHADGTACVLHAPSFAGGAACPYPGDQHVDVLVRVAPVEE
jgi:hypothetical protein